MIEQKKMNVKLRMLQMIDKKVGLQNFYCITLTDYELALQGYATDYLVKTIKRDYNIELKLGENGFIEGKTKCIKICLTLK